MRQERPSASAASNFRSISMKELRFSVSGIKGSGDDLEMDVLIGVGEIDYALAISGKPTDEETVLVVPGLAEKGTDFQKVILGMTVEAVLPFLIPQRNSA